MVNRKGLPGTAGISLIEVLVLALEAVVSRLVALPAVSQVLPCVLLLGVTVPPRCGVFTPGLPDLKLSAKHLLHIDSSQSPGTSVYTV